MGIIFLVANTVEVFPSPLAESISAAIHRETEFDCDNPGKSGAFRSDTFFQTVSGAGVFNWNRWKKFQDHVAALIGGKSVPNLLSVKAPFGVFLPCEINPTVLTVGNVNFNVASLPKLFDEIQVFSSAGGARWALGGIRDLVGQIRQQVGEESIELKYDDIFDVFMALNSALASSRLRRQPLWIAEQPNF